MTVQNNFTTSWWLISCVGCENVKLLWCCIVSVNFIHCSSFPIGWSLCLICLSLCHYDFSEFWSDKDTRWRNPATSPWWWPPPLTSRSPLRRFITSQRSLPPSHRPAPKANPRPLGRPQHQWAPLWLGALGSFLRPLLRSVKVLRCLWFAWMQQSYALYVWF